MKFSIITCNRNNESWLKKHLDSVKNQTYQNYEHIIIDDASTDSSLSIIEQNCNPQKTKCFVRKERSFAVRNHILGLKQMTGDIVVHLDGDDWFFDENVLQKLFDVYKKTDCWATYGSYTYPDQQIRLLPHPTEKAEDVRRMGLWSFTHLRSFKKELISAIPAMDLFNYYGDLHSFAADVAILCGIYEYAFSQNKVHFINEPLVIYNNNTGQNDHTFNLQDQCNSAIQVYNSPYSVLRLLK
jgi:glycosyltransferase involved in cell wall biosynthesis